MEVVELNGEKGAQSILLPAAFTIDDDKVYVKRTGNAITLIPYHSPWQNLYESLDLFTADFMNEREQPSLDKRESLS